VKWFSEAAAYDLADSQYNLAMLYENGLGVPKDAKQAYKWLALAAKSGDAEAKKHRGGLKAMLSPADAEEAMAQADTWQAKRSNPMANDPQAGQPWMRSRTKDGGDYRRRLLRLGRPYRTASRDCIFYRFDRQSSAHLALSLTQRMLSEHSWLRRRRRGFGRHLPMLPAAPKARRRNLIRKRC
jgi:hypothetical protein